MKRHLVFFVLFAAITLFIQFSDIFGEMDDFLTGIAFTGAFVALVSYIRKRRSATVTRTP